MRHRSSTSSSEPPATAGGRSASRVPWGVVWAVAFLALFELCVVRADAFWAVPEQSTTGIVHRVEAAAMQASPRPTVIAVGSSRIRDALIPSVVAETLGLGPGSVANASITAGTPVDAEAMYSRNADWFGSAQTLVVGVDDWTFTRSIPLSVRERWLAPYSTLVDAHEGALHTLLAARDHLCKTIVARGRIHGLLTAPWRVRHRLTVDADGRVLRNPIDGSEFRSGIDVSSDVERFHARPEPASYRTAALERLIERATDDGVQVVIAVVPWRDAYVDGVERARPTAWPSFRDRLAELTARHPGVRTAIVLRASSINVSDTMLRDYGHLGRGGAERYSRWFAETHRELLLRRRPR